MPAAAYRPATSPAAAPDTIQLLFLRNSGASEIVVGIDPKPSYWFKLGEFLASCFNLAQVTYKRASSSLSKLIKTRNLSFARNFPHEQ